MTLGAGLVGIAIGAVIGAVLGSVWSAKDFRRQARLDSYTKFVAAFVPATADPATADPAAGCVPAADARNIREISYYAVRLVASEAGGRAATRLYEAEVTDNATRKAAVEEFCIAAGKDITSWRRN